MEASGGQGMYYVAFFVTAYQSFEEAQAKAPETIAAHLKRSKEFHTQGTLLMAGAFLNNPGEPLSTNGMVTNWYIRRWANILA